LQKALQDPDERVREEAQEALGRMAGKEKEGADRD
jgi:hypothetical protein